jgi:hypothetical protein
MSLQMIGAISIDILRDFEIWHERQEASCRGRIHVLGRCMLVYMQASLYQ